MKRGVDTYWLSQPLRTAVQHRHALTLEGGSEALRYKLYLGLNQTPGVMKESRRSTQTAALDLSYRYRKLLMKIFRYSDVGLVTPLRDGMNLVAKEYVAAQDPANPGVLVLSQFAGAANELTSALIVNPYDRDEVAAALDRALTMSLAERISRHAEMLDVIVKNDINHWQECFISDLKQIVPRSAESQQRDKVATFPKLA